MDETLGYLLRPPMRSAGGGIHSAEDADSEGVEGRFYVWSEPEVRSVGGDAAVEWYGVTPAGNWEGANILHRPVRGDLLRPPEVEAARRRLLDARGRAGPPGLDDKVITEWNAMAVAALAEAGGATGRADWVDAAVEIATFLDSALRRPSDGRWLRSWQGGRAGRNLAYAVDYAWLVEAFTRLAEATGQAAGWRAAREAADDLLAPVLGRGGGRPVHHRPRRRAADRAVQGHLRRGHAVGQLGGRGGPAAAGRADRVEPATATPAAASSS